MKLIILTFFLAIQVFPQWENKHGNLPASYIPWSMDAIDSLTALVSINPAGFPSPETLYKTSDGGITWHGLLGLQEYTIVDISMVDENHYWICTSYPQKIFATTDGGNTFVQQFEAPDTLTEWFNYIEMFDLNNGIAMGDAPLSDTTKTALFLKTTNGGTNWISLDVPFIGGYSHNIWHLIDFVSPEVGFFRPSFYNTFVRPLYRTTDGAATWQQLNTIYGTSSNLKFHNQDYGLIYKVSYAAPTGGYVLRTTDSGNSWDSVFISLENPELGLDFEFLKNDPSKVWFTTIKSLFFSTDNGKTWSKEALQFTNGQDLVVVDGNVCWFLCETVYRNSNADHITTIEDDQLYINHYHLYQNYPNPFNPKTIISYQLPVGSNVQIKIYDMLGNEIQVLVEEYKNAGRYEINFNSLDYSSGIYFYQLRAGNYKETKKMILMR